MRGVCCRPPTCRRRIVLRFSPLAGLALWSWTPLRGVGILLRLVLQVKCGPVECQAHPSSSLIAVGILAVPVPLPAGLRLLYSRTR